MKKEFFDKAVALRHELHAHPELSNEEEWTKQRLKDFVREHTDLEIVDKGYYFYVAYRSKNAKKNIGFRADIDALPMDEYLDLEYGSKIPGKAHKCGHDGHSASLAGLILEVNDKRPDANVFFVFQPAEETGDGAKVCKEFIKENDIEEIYAFHNMSRMKRKSINVIDDTAHFSSKGMSIFFEGEPSHASQPELGKNPSFAIAKIINKLGELTQKGDNKGDVLATVVEVKVGDKAFGVNPGKGVLRFTIRAYYEEEMDKLQKNLEELAKEYASHCGIKVRFEYQDYFPVTKNHKESSDKVREVAKKLGYVLVEMPEAFRGSEDFGYYTKETKGAMFYIGNGMDYPGVHTNEYDFLDEQIEIAVNMWYALIEI